MCAMYTDHNMFELYAVLLENNIPVTTQQMSWYGLVALIREHKIEPAEATYALPKWDIEIGRYDEFRITINHPKFHIMEDDTFIGPDGDKYIISDINFANGDVSVYYQNGFDSDVVRDACIITIMNMENEATTTMTAWDFIHTMSCMDFQFIKSRWLKYVNK